MVYLALKELTPSAEDVIMVTSSIMKDTAVGSDVLYRANAIRTLCRIIDVRVTIPIRINVLISIPESSLPWYKPLRETSRLP